jgi:hypothetical protein
MAQYEDITIDQGTDVAIEIHLANIDGTKKDLTGYSVAAQIRRTINSSDSDAVTFTSIVADPSSDGIITLVLTNVQTMALTPPRYFYDVEISYVDSDSQLFIERVLYGNLHVNPNITRL